MNIVDVFGGYVDKFSQTSPSRARWLLRTGWEAQKIRQKLTTDKMLMPADRYLAELMMNTMIRPLKTPEQSAIVSIFTPCELLQEAGLYPYNVEGFSCYLAGTHIERSCIQQAENSGLSETLCSYHKTFLGAAEKGLLPKPKCIVYTNLVCDANLVTFRALAELFDVPAFAIDVPMQQNADNVRYVADQLRELAKFLERQTGKKIDISRVKRRVARTQRTMRNYDAFQTKRADRYIPADLVSPLYAGMTGNILLGTQEELHYTQMLLRDVERAKPAMGKRIYWMHTIPYWSDAVAKQLRLREDAQIVGCELAHNYPPELEFDPAQPFEAMAKRMVCHALNGGIKRRIETGIYHAKQVKADGAVWFAHWGCKHTLGGAQIAKRMFEEAGIPLLILDGDGCDRSHGGEGQTATRLGAFLEMLGGAEHE